ncbi:hypothetical protein PZA11_002820 [Diplocarpon coronariae]
MNLSFLVILAQALAVYADGNSMFCGYNVASFSNGETCTVRPRVQASRTALTYACV